MQVLVGVKIILFTISSMGLYFGFSWKNVGNSRMF